MLRTGAELDLVGAWRMALRQRWRIVWVLAGTLVLAFAYYFFGTRTYRAEAQLLVVQKDSNLPAQGVEAEAVDTATQMYEELLATHMQILTSSRIVKQALQTHGFDTLPSILDAKKWYQEPWEYVTDQLDVDRGGKGSAAEAHVISVTFDHRSSKDAAAILEAVVESYRKFLDEEFQDVNKDAVELISQARLEVGQELKKEEDAYIDFCKSAPLFWKHAGGTTNIHQERLVELEAALADVRLQRTRTKARLDVMEQALDRAEGRNFTNLERLALLNDKDVDRLSLLLTVENGDSQSETFQSAQPARVEAARALHEDLLILLQQEKTLLAKVGSDHPKMLETRQKIEVTSAFLQKHVAELGKVNNRSELRAADLVNASIDLLRHDLSELQRRERELEILSEQEQAATKSLISYQLQAEVMRGEVDRRSQLYDVVLERLREINMVKDYGGVLTEVITPVHVPIKPVWPRGSIVMILGAVLGLMAGLGFAYVADNVEDTFHSPDEIRQTLKLPVIAEIPDFNAPEKAVRGKRSRRIQPAVVSVPPGAGQLNLNATVASSIICYHRTNPRSSEAFSALRTALFFSAHDNKHKVIQIASASSGDGRTTVVANLAVSMAQAGKKVLMVDADLRRPQLHRLFTLENKCGLSDILLGQTTVADAIQETAVNNLWAVTGGSMGLNSAELLQETLLRQLFAAVREQYDFVLIDSPPLLAVVDPCILATCVDIVVLTIQLGKNVSTQSTRVKEKLDALKSPLVGIVVNRLRPQDNFGSSVARLDYVTDQESSIR